jgi:photosystem II stability/assembly factor-like uncharacterized protein
MKIAIYVLLISTVLFSQDRWKKLNGPPGGEIKRVVANGDTLIAGGIGTIFYSFNKGEKWQQSDFRIKDGVLDFVFTHEGSVLAACQNWGIYKSDDFINWRQINQSGRFRSLGKDDTGIIYAGTEYGQIYSSADNGENWVLEFTTQRRINGFLYNSGKLFVGGTQKILIKDTSWRIIPFDSISAWFDFFVDSSGNIYTYVSPYIFVSSDSGNTWVNQPTGTFFHNNSMYGCTFNNRIIGGFGDETGWFGDGWGAAVSDDLGVTWRWSQSGLPPKISGYKLAVSGTDTYLATNAAGVFKSTDFGDSWFEQNNGLNAAVVVRFIIDKDDIFYAASWSNGLSKSTDKGKTWTMINNGVSNVYFCSVVADNNCNLMAGSEYGVYRSTDKGESWIQTSSVGNNSGNNLMIDSKNRIYCLTYGSGLFRTTDLGNTWQRLDNNFNSGYIFGLAIDRENNIYTGTGKGAVYKSTDDGLSWVKIFQSNAAYASIADVKISPDGIIFIACNREGVLRSTDEGVNWTLVKNNSGFMHYYPLEISNKGVIFTVDSNWKIYSSSDNGNIWEDITSNTKYLKVHSFTVDKYDNIYLATDESIWKSNTDTLTNVAEDDIKPKEYFLSQNYPNPFNPSTTIKYSLAEAGRVTLSIYDLLGREVVKLIDEEKPSGEYEIKWNASGYPSGVYFLRMQAGEFSETRKFLLMK